MERILGIVKTADEAAGEKNKQAAESAWRLKIGAEAATETTAAEAADATAAGGCLSCGRPLRGRLDKKFCNAGCRNVYYNHRQRAERRQIGEVDLVLKHK